MVLLSTMKPPNSHFVNLEKGGFFSVRRIPVLNHHVERFNLMFLNQNRTLEKRVIAGKHNVITSFFALKEGHGPV